MTLFSLFACAEPDPVAIPDPLPDTFDCAAMPDEAQPERILEGARGYKGLAFDLDGNIVGWDENALIKSDYEGNWEVFLPGLEDPEQMLTLPDGDLVVTTSFSDGSILRISPDGGTTRLASNVYAYSVIQGPDEMLYGAGWEGVFRVHPRRGDVTTLKKTSFDDISFRAMAFSLDHSRLYMGAVDDRGRIFYWDLDEDLEPMGDLKVFAEGVGRGWHDGLVLDSCGYMYVVEYESNALYRISPDGSDVRTLVEWSRERDFGHGLVWGTGEDGWRADAVYLPSPNDGSVVKEIVLGVPGPGWTGELSNGPD